jgi:nucleoside-diphosphate-sugar epimerase
MEKGKLEAIIARAPDFFGPIKDKSLMMYLIYDNLAKGKPAQWFCSADAIHTTGFAPDLAKGTAILGNSPNTFNQVWNLPVDQNALTGRQWVKLFADEMQRPDKIQVLPGWGMKILGLFVPFLKEMYEMRYQYDRAYFFDSTRFISRFDHRPTPNAEAVRQTIESLKQSSAAK